MSTYYDQVQEAVRAVGASERPTVGVVLGSGLSAFVEQIDEPRVIPYRDIPNFPVSKVEGHKGDLILGKIGDARIVVMSGGISLSSRLIKGGGYALKTPVIDISEVGAGGGSIVWLDKAGQIKVVGFDNIPAIRPLIKSGKVLATVDQFGTDMAANAIDQGLKSRKEGKPLKGWVKTPIELVTARNLK